LHYEHKRPHVPDHFNTLLIDAGAKINGYGSDITRTFTTDENVFNDLLISMDSIQQTLANKAIHGVDYRDLHLTCLTEIANLLQESQICSLPADEQIAKGITQTFFPHGLGHLLGLQVHDVGGHQVSPEGDILKPQSNAPYLRLTRTLESNMVITIEPGLYFIPMLLEKMLSTVPQHGCDMSLIKSLLPFGGIRIEDNVLVKDNMSVNLTRQS